jgi:hypothetical protein
MTDEQILEKVEEFFGVGGVRDDGSFSEFYVSKEDVIEFARDIYGEGYGDGCFQVTGG